ncbi:CheR family methyltransferase [Aquabacterium sp. OR-4]|uniref:CheR family methyltransferase n=1 Tax=Aquabacterium sp. OR-4 TaxID=2978127 RepID=UPI0021B380AF|nr:CheR family methyltransferase [Aquabacterium sp. OR-4]MDT7834005.1 CheR family methyltransferase [Aquabacterium sp. OR-4]
MTGAVAAAGDREADAVSALALPWIVAVGASAGGLEALQQFFGALRLPTQAAFVVIQHLAPDHRSMMSELLARCTTLPVQEALAGESLQADRVYLMPPGVLMTIAHQQLVFAPRPEHGVSLPIDAFFRSLAATLADRSVGVVLSGSGSDGSVGAAALRDAGGYVMVQSSETAKFDSMPRATQAATQVDAVLPPDGLALKVLALTRGQSGRVPSGELVDLSSVKPALQRLFELLLSHTGVDFSQYKLPTMMRRIERRMGLLGCASVSDYADRVAASAEECELLRRELLIPVTGFFRDPEAFAALGEALRARLQRQGSQQPLRVWCAGCATGEEAYSVVIALLEACQETQRWPGFKVFATDVDQRFLNVASAGVYPAGVGEQLSPQRVAQHFTRQDDRLTVRAELRQLVLFARHNMLEDAPFTKMDLVVCRNTLIYFQAEAQERVMRRLQYALNPDGLLFLGSSESLGALQPDFQVVDAARKLFRLVRPVLALSALRDGMANNSPALRRRTGERGLGAPQISGAVDAALALLLDEYVPVSLLITAQRQLLHAWGPTERYLRVPRGQPNLDAIRMLPPRLGAVVGHAMQRALHDRQMHVAPVLPLQVDGHEVLVRVTARALGLEGEGNGSVLVSLVEAAAVPGMALQDRALDEGELDRLVVLERELADTRLTLQTSIEELEAANEELQATNEELMSANEELQSTNEELQSVNEELYTVNAEYNAKLDQISALHADLDGMSQATGIATLFVDQQLSLVRFTPEAANLFRLRRDDTGRAITDFNCQLDYPQLADDLRQVVDGSPPVEREVGGPGLSRHLVRALGYSISGLPGSPRRAVLTLVDVSRMRDLDRLQRLIDSLDEHVAVLDRNGTIVQVNLAWSNFAQCNRGLDGDLLDTGVGSNYLGVIARSNTEDGPWLLRGLQAVLAGSRTDLRLIYPCHSPDEKRWFMLRALPLRPDRDGRHAGAVISHLNITPWVGPDGPPPPHHD